MGKYLRCILSEERQQEVIYMNHSKTQRLTGLALFTAVIVVLQIVSTLLIHFGLFSITFALIPIVVGAALYGPSAGAYLGAVFSLVALVASITGADPGGAIFWNAQPFFTVLTIMVKGSVAGLAAGAVYRALEGKNQLAAVIVAAIVCPLVNTGIFLLAVFTLFHDLLVQLAGGTNVFVFALTGMVGINFLVEFAVNLVLSPVVARIINARRAMPTGKR